MKKALGIRERIELSADKQVKVLVQARINKQLRDKVRAQIKKDRIEWEVLINACFVRYLFESEAS